MPKSRHAPKGVASPSFPSGTAVSFQPKKRAAYNVKVLSGLDRLNLVTMLHEKARAEMSETQRHFLLPKPPGYFRDLLTGKTGILLSSFANDEPVGSLSVVWADSFAAAHAEGRLTCPDPDGHLAKTYCEGHVGVIQAMSVRSAYMGRGFSRALIQAAIKQANRHGCVHLFAQIAEQNTLSWLRFLDQDFALLAVWASEHRRFLLRWLPPEEKERLISRSGAAGRQSFSKNYAQLPSLMAQLEARLEQGYMAFLDNKPDESGTLRFVFSHERLS